jgi:hypothetical protein
MKCLPRIPAWKRIILTQRDWPTHLRLPLDSVIPPKATQVMGGSDEGNSWDWKLKRDPSGKFYHLQAWLVSAPRRFDSETKSVKLTPAEALQLCIRQCIPPELLAGSRRRKVRKR